ncbi:penicillin-binding transpeptidase domain-containing protein [Nocardia sp. PE-7]|uniref:penicillin-binding transpeptidase domain-containing protein n=1 Tax=Nocardia sp. PE-7 TaxID=3058426 RepID=UPI0026582A61|nr:penicillin-binding transpeptidase domain-containing protein [Nocardia sp. PE-7]WKG07861.1 penicillin-binding transpeptidase domain-containing protein [Nocardia sp. PE-7]
MRTRMLTTCAVVALAVAATACSSGAQGPVPAADAFAAAFAEHDLAAAAALTTAPEKATAALTSTWQALQAEKLSIRTGDARVNGDTATVDYTYEWTLPKGRQWTYSGELQMGRSDGRWLVRWSSADIHPKLGDTQSMELRTRPAPRARVNESAGSDVLVPGKVSRVKFTVADAPDPSRVAGALAAALSRIDPVAYTPQTILTSARKTDGAHTVVLLNEYEAETIGGELIGLPGVTLTQEWDMVPTDRKFAPDLLTQVRKTVIAEVDGKAGWSVVTRNADGADLDVLHEEAAQPAPSFALSIDRFVQNSAQHAVDLRTEQTMMVVLRPSTGAILAVAQNKAADRDGPVATSGQYPPGSIFKTVTASAAMASGLATPETVLPCPSSTIIGERTIPNYNMFSVGDVPMATAYERSCNTTFARLASKLEPDALTQAAARLGVGQDYRVEGLPTMSGSVPKAEGLVQRAEDGIGQGRVVVSPFGMAVMAATVAHGAAPVPYLITGRPTEITGDRPAIAPEVVEGLRSMMRMVVTGGTAERIRDQGEVYGKTGEAEVDGGSHSWFVGYRGDIAFATLLVKGGSSDNAVAVTRDMFAALPAGY